MKPTGIALIGYGGIGRIHAMAYRDLTLHYGLPTDLVRLVGVATTRSETAEKAAREIGGGVWTTDYRELLERDDVHVVDVCVPNYRHEEIVLAAAQAGKHIYCEKPLAMNVAQGRRMLEAAQKAGVKHQVTFNFRFFPAVLRARQLMSKGFVGRVFSFRGRYHRSSYISPDKPLSWRLQRRFAGGGALFDLGSHLLDLVQFLLGETKEVQATLETLIRERPVARGAEEKGRVDVDDLALLELRLENGALGVLDVSRMGTGATNDLELEVFGDQGAIRFNLANPNWLYIYDAREPSGPFGGTRGFKRLETVQHFEGQLAPHWTMPVSFVRSHAESQYRFLKAIWQDEQPRPDMADGLRVQAIMEAAYLSTDTQRWVRVDEL